MTFVAAEMEYSVKLLLVLDHGYWAVGILKYWQYKFYLDVTQLLLTWHLIIALLCQQMVRLFYLHSYQVLHLLLIIQHSSHRHQIRFVFWFCEGRTPDNWQLLLLNFPN